MNLLSECLGAKAHVLLEVEHRALEVRDVHEGRAQLPPPLIHERRRALGQVSETLVGCRKVRGLGLGFGQLLLEAIHQTVMWAHKVSEGQCLFPPFLLIKPTLP